MFYFDAADAGVPVVHLLHSEEQDVLKFLRRRVEFGLESENLPVARQNFTIDHISVLLKEREVRDVL